MAETLSFGFIVPENGDTASIWQPAIEDTIRQLNDHTHDGVDSSTISPASITPLTTAAPAVSWAALGNGNFSQVVTAPAAISEVNNSYPKVFEDSSGNVLYPSIERTAANQITIFTNNNVDMTVVWR